MDVNTTPLIDVMLVLIVMLIITIPIQLHSVNLDMPAGTPQSAAIEGSGGGDEVDHRLRRHGQLWNGVALANMRFGRRPSWPNVAAEPDQSEVHMQARTSWPSMAASAAVMADGSATGCQEAWAWSVTNSTSSKTAQAVITD